MLIGKPSCLFLARSIQGPENQAFRSGPAITACSQGPQPDRTGI